VRKGAPLLALDRSKKLDAVRTEAIRIRVGTARELFACADLWEGRPFAHPTE
jgi:hypothetical protein